MKKSVIILFALLSTLASAQLGGKVVKKSGPQQPTTQHQVALTWTQSTGPGTITGNNVYRCTGNACTGYALLYSSTTPILAYTDTTVAAGATYTYVVTAVAGAEESNYSSQYVAVIRNPPAAPTGLAGTAQ